jgi:DNA mismatch repair protein MutS2
MQPSTLKALEFDRVREALAAHAATPLGRARALDLEPSSDAAEVAQALALTSEGVRFTAAGGSLGLWAPEDLDTLLEILGVEGQALEPQQLTALARFAESVDHVVEGIRNANTGAEESGSLLRTLVAASKPFTNEIAAVRRAIDPSGDVRDDASPALKEIREKLRRQRAKLRSTLEGLSRGRDTAKYLQDQIVTDRNGRYVLVLRAEHRDAIPGIVHGSSASGASLYLEPLSTVELNNETVALTEKETAEVFRILLALTNGFRRREDDLAAMLSIAADLDELYAKVELAARLDGIAPALTDDGRLEFRGARHPLLIGRTSGVVFSAKPSLLNRNDTTTSEDDFREKTTPDVLPTNSVVASDLLVVPPTRALVISGPNTGGKTVALKAFGLLAVMAQSGLLIPVEPGSAFTPFRSIFANIGDDQSISASLSTFSARIAQMVEIERALDLPSLVLLDEVGSGTDPVEGGALGTAVIDHFRRRGALVVATTHDDALKSYAATTEGVAAGAFGFNAETYAPTYRLIYGAPGRSLALEISERLGMPAAVIADARARRSGRESLLAAHLARVDKELALLDQERATTERERAKLADERQALLARETRLAEREAVLKRRMDDKLNERLREARAEVDKVVADLKAKAQSLGAQAETRLKGAKAPVTTGELGELKAEARAALETIGGSVETIPAADDRDAAPTEVPPVGTTVHVTTFMSDGIVRGGYDKNVDVEIRGKRMRVALKDLRLRRGPGSKVQSPKSAAVQASERPTVQRSLGPQVQGSDRLTAATMELMVIGSTVDAAMDKIEKFLDDALMADARILRVVHGHGTGKLRDAVREFFRKHPLVADVSAAPDNQGGGGATIVVLKD